MWKHDFLENDKELVGGISEILNRICKTKYFLGENERLIEINKNGIAFFTKLKELQ